MIIHDNYDNDKVGIIIDNMGIIVAMMWLILLLFFVIVFYYRSVVSYRCWDVFLSFFVGIMLIIIVITAG